MNLLQEHLARAHRQERQALAQRQRRGRQVQLARRLGRKAEVAALRTRLAVARVV